MYTPICLPNWRYRLTACRSLCESARDGCMPVMQTYGFGWPERMNCDLLPEGVSMRAYQTLEIPNLSYRSPITSMFIQGCRTRYLDGLSSTALF